MARLTGPLFSLAASGTIAKTLTYANWKGIPYARTRVIPANPNTLPQQEVRGIFSTLNEMWKRMPAENRLPWQYAVRGIPMTARNRFIQANVAALQGDATLIDLVQSVSGGQALPPTEPWSHDEGDGTVTLQCVPPTAPIGYTQTHITYFAVLDGDPSPVLTRTPLTGSRIVAPWHIVLTCPVNGVYRCQAIARFTRDSDSLPFCSSGVECDVTSTGP